MICTQCKDPIPFEDDISVRVVRKDGSFEQHCKHNPFDETDPSIVAILGSVDCYERWRKEQIVM